MIYTVTFNPSIDYVIQVEDFKPGQVNRVKNDYKYPGGKGINVSRVLNNLNVESKVLGFIGGFVGEYVEAFLHKEDIATDFITVKEDTRINVKLKSNDETEINGAGPTIKSENLDELFCKLNKLTADDFLVLAGNIQSSLPVDMYAQIQKVCQKSDVKVIVDTTGEALRATLKYKPFLIKPNNHELADMFDVEINTKEDIIKYAKKLVEMGAQNVIISMAAEGGLLVCNDGVYQATAPKGVVKNSVGAGDSLIGGFLSNYSKSNDIIEAFRWGTAAGSATAFSLDLCEKDYVEELLKTVIITNLEY